MLFLVSGHFVTPVFDCFRWKWGEGRISHYPPPRVETGRLSGAEAGGAAGGIKTHPFFIMHYMNKARREAAATAAGSSAT